MNYSDRKAVRVTRILLPSSLELTQSQAISNTWVDKLSYDISVPSKVFSLGSLIPVTFALLPIAPDLRVRSVSCVLKEYITLTAGEHTKLEGKVIKHIRDETFASSPEQWTKTELLPVPDFHSGLIQTDSFSDLLKIKHKLKFTVSLINADGHISGKLMVVMDGGICMLIYLIMQCKILELRAAIPIVIAEISPEEDENALPAYEDAWKSVPYDPQQLAALVERGDLPPSLALTAPNQAAIDARSRLSSDTDDEDSRASTPTGSRSSAADQLSLPWEGIDLSRVPSYTTAIRSNRLYSFSGSLPGYDSIAVPGRAA
jgi:hypothetical protein